MRKEIRIRGRDMQDLERKDAETALSEREREIRLAMLIAEVEAVPENSFEQGGLNRLFSVLERDRIPNWTMPAAANSGRTRRRGQLPSSAAR